MKSTVLGRGEIGKAVSKVIQATDTVTVYDILDEEPKTSSPTDVLHICFPPIDGFVKEVQGYIAQYKPEHVIIWSTVPIGTTKQIKGAVHSPVEGRHPNLDLSIKNMVRWVGANNTSEAEFFERYFKMLFINTKVVDNSDFTEALKLLSTTEYGINIEFARYKKMVANSLGMDFKLTKEWNRHYNKLYHNLGLSDIFQKFVLDAPEGPKGGHCVTPNAEILYEQYPSELVKIVGEI